MNLHGIASGCISAVNPMVPAELYVSTGSATAPDGSRTPSYAAPVTVQAQRQAYTFQDLQHLDNLNIQGATVPMYLGGLLNAANRVTQQGGDMVRVDGKSFLVVAILEEWPDWCKVSLQLQVNPAPAP